MVSKVPTRICEHAQACLRFQDVRGWRARGPTASGMEPLAATASNGLVKAAFDAVKVVCDRDGRSLSASFGNFDRIVGLGWLVGDALGHALLSREDAFKLGGAASKRATALPSEIADARRAILRPASKLDAADPKRQELAAAADAAQVRLLQSAPVPPLPLPHTSVKPQATGSRKRARPKPEPPAAERSTASMDRAEAAVLVAKREQRRAERRFRSADAKYQLHGPKMLRMVDNMRQFLAKPKPKRSAKKHMARAIKLRSMHVRLDKATGAWHQVCLERNVAYEALKGAYTQVAAANMELALHASEYLRASHVRKRARPNRNLALPKSRVWWKRMWYC